MLPYIRFFPPKLSKKEKAHQAAIRKTQALWKKVHRDCERLLKPFRLVSATVTEKADSILPEGIPELPQFSVQLDKTSLGVSLVDGISTSPVGRIFGKFSSDNIEEMEDLLESAEFKYLETIKAMTAEIRGLRDQLAAGYLGHPDNLVPSMSDIESSTSEEETMDELDKIHAKKVKAAEKDKEIGKKVKVVEPAGFVASGVYRAQEARGYPAASTADRIFPSRLRQRSTVHYG